jgi:type IV secretory pathway VirB4 component
LKRTKGKTVNQLQKADRLYDKTVRPNEKLSPMKKLRLVSAVRKAKKQGRIALSAQETIPYREMFRDGICRINEKYYTKTIQFYDINYQLAQAEDKNTVFEHWCDFLNYFDNSIKFQLCFVNRQGDIQELAEAVEMPEQGDSFDEYRHEFSEMLKSQLAKGNNGLIKTKYICFGVEADELRTAKTRLEHVETDVLAGFRALGVTARTLNGYERLKLLHGSFHPNGGDKFQFNWDLVHRTGLSDRDFIAPSSFSFDKGGRFFRLGQTFGAGSFLQILAPELTDRMLSDFLSLENGQMTSFQVESINQSEAIKMIKRKLSDIDKMKVEEQKKAVRAGYDPEIIPSDLKTYGEEAEKLLKDMQSRNERLFLVTVILTTFAETKRKLEDTVFQTAGIAQKYNCALQRLDYQQEEGLMSSAPLGLNLLPIQRALTTSSLAVFIPFTTEELFTLGEALYYGINPLSNNIIMADRKSLLNPNGIIIGIPGSGKSFATKRELTNVYFAAEDDIIVCDPEGEYGALTEALNGQIIRVSPVSKQYVNPMDLNLNYSDEDNPLAFKTDFLLSLFELIAGSKSGLEPIEKTVIDRCVRLVYTDYLSNPAPENMPVLGCLHRILLNQKESEAQRLAAALEIYVSGSLNVFNNRTNVDVNNRLVTYDIKELGKQLKKIGMLIVQDQVWNRVTINRAKKKSTRFYINEFHFLLKEEQTSAYSVEIFKRFRKWGGIPTAITQNIKDLLASREVENIFENSDFILMLNQAAGDREILAKKLNISPTQLSYVTGSGAGEGLLFYGNTIIPFVDHFPTDGKLYRIMTTKLSETGVL